MAGWKAEGESPPSVASTPVHCQVLGDLVEPFDPKGRKGRDPANVAELLATCRPADAVRLAAARAAGVPVYGTVAYRRWDRKKVEGRALAVRTDGMADCLLAKADLHHVRLLRVDGGHVGIRSFTPRELARPMGLREGYRMPSSVSRSARLVGEGVAVPAVRWLAANLLEPLVAGTTRPPAPPPRSGAAPSAPGRTSRMVAAAR